MVRRKTDLKVVLEVREITDEEFQGAIETWYPKLVKFAGNNIPFLDWDDKIQEGQLVLYKCLQRFEEGFISKKNGAGKGLKTVFHTYFHTALNNRAGVLTARRLSHNGELAREVEKRKQDGTVKLTKSGKPETKCVENPSRITYIGEIEDAAMERTYTVEKMALSEKFGPSAEFELESWGFEGVEIAYMLGTALHDLSLAETAKLFGIDVASLKAAESTATAKMERLRETEDGL